MVSLPSERSTRFGNPARPGFKTANFAAFGSWSWVLPKNAESLGTAMRSCASLFRGVAAPLGCVICLQLGDVAVFSLCAQYFLNVRGGGGITTLGPFRTFRKPCVARCQNGILCRFWVLVRCASEGHREPRDSDAFMRVAVPRRRGPAGLRNLFLLLSELWPTHHVFSAFRMCETRGGITTLGVLCVLLKRRTAACQNGSFAVF